MRQMYRAALVACVVATAFAAGADNARAQVTQNATNSGAVSNPSSGTNTIDLGGGGLGAGASVSTSASGAVSSTSFTGINTQFSLPSPPSLGVVTQGATNDTGAAITNNGAITGLAGSAGNASSLGVGANGAAASLSILGVGGGNSTVGGIPLVPLSTVGEIVQGTSALILAPSLPVTNNGTVSNTGEIGGASLDLSGQAASAAVSATGAATSVAITALGASQFTGTSVGNILQAPTNLAQGFIANTLSANGIALGNISGAGAGVSAAATGAAAGVSFLYVSTQNWAGVSGVDILQAPTNNGIVVNSAPNVTVGAISGDGASVRLGATGASAGISFASIGSAAAAGGPGHQFAGFGQFVINTAGITNSGAITGTGLTGLGSSAIVSATGAGASLAVSSINDLNNASLSSAGGGVVVGQTASNQAGPIANSGSIALGSGSLANGAAAAVSATGAQAVVSVNVINTSNFTSPFFGLVLQTATNDGPTPITVSNAFGDITAGALSGHGASVSASATGAAASIAFSFIATPNWTTIPMGAVMQTATNTGSVINQSIGNGISVGDISGAGASARVSATGAAASIAVSNIMSIGPTPGAAFGSPSIVQTATNGGIGNGSIIANSGSIAVGALSGAGSSAAINATGAAASIAAVTVNTGSAGAPAFLMPTVTQTASNTAPVSNTGSIAMAGSLGTAAAASIGAVGASASAAFTAIR